MAKKRKLSLPRVTLIAYGRKDLLAFVSAVESLRHLVDDLRVVAESLQRKAQTPPKKKPAAIADAAVKSGDAVRPV